MVHLYRLFDKNICLDVNSGAVFLPDELSYRIIGLVDGAMTEDCPERIYDALKDFDREEIKGAWGEIYGLYSEGLLFSEDTYSDIDLDKHQSMVIKALCLHVSHDCNLRCDYCFAGTGNFGGGRKVMSPDVARKAIDFVIEMSANRRNIEIDFFGGEPLMAMETVKATVEYARAREEETGKKFRFTITTNGLLLNDENIDYINKTMDNCVLSVDGRRENHDLHRKTKEGSGSYDIVMPRIRKLVSQRDGEYYARGTYTANNLDFAEDVLHLADQGIDQISIEPVVTASGEYAISCDDLEVIYAEYERLAGIMLKRRDFNFFHFNVDLDQGPCVIKRLKGCGAGYEYVAITPEGEIYPCHQFVGKEKYKLGSLENGVTNAGLSEYFSRLNVLTRKGCKDCWAKFYCSGGCSAANLEMNGNIEEPDLLSCDIEKKRLECAIAIKACEFYENL